ncbi:MAG: NERD domain-containing protein, partial [Planctomycetota bacterium]|nr:NERD domain-containing protein [Planctomycetota bacterium]
MRMIPEHVHEFPGDSAAEKKVFDLFKNSSLPGTVLHSFNLSKHRYKKWAEIDFLCVLPFGMMGIEVKGGKVSRLEGKWFTYHNQLNESPFDQVRGAMFELTRLLGSEKMVGVNFGWGVLLPDSPRVPETPEHPYSMLGDYQTCGSQSKFDRWLASLVDYWISKKRLPDLSQRRIGELVKNLRPNFDRPIPLGEHARRLNERILQFSEEQFDKMDEITENDRIICRGGAGTGKTFLALETVRREAAQGRRVLLVARSPGLVDWIRSGLPLPDVTVLSADDLCLQEIQDDAFDLLVVDEGQDLLVMRYFEVLDRVLCGGLTHGRWRWFMDDQNQAGLHSDTDQSLCDQFLIPTGTFKRLRKNCRNTREIVEFTQYTTGADIGEAELEGGGEIPEFDFVDHGNEARSVMKRLDLWHEQDIHWDRMVVLICDPG